MARKSRKQTANDTPEVLAIQPADPTGVLATGAYARLSSEKDDNRSSIQTQVLLLHDFIAEHPELRLTETYIDDGYSGTNFERPDFVRLMDDVRSGKIQCIVVKDLSRFGRDFLETGYYIETLLPRLNVRLIAVTDNFDSSREEDVNNIAVPIKNMVNELYAKDFSRKVSAYHDLHRQCGDVHLTRTVYGYAIDKERNVYVPNPDTAPIVKMIFRWFLMGYRTGQIAERLNLLGVQTPLQYKMIVEKGEAFEQEDHWNMARIRDILRNEKYIGDLIWGKRAKRLYMNIPEHKTPREEWVVWHDMHEPLIQKEDFDRAQAMLDHTVELLKEKPVYQTGDVDSFPRKIYCAECGKRMHYQKLCYQNRNGAIYYCKKNNGEGWHQQIHADFLRLFVSDQIQVLIQAMCDRKKLIEKAKKGSSASGNLFATRRKAAQLKVALEQEDRKLAKLYEDFSEGLLSMSDYQDLRQHYGEEKERILKQIEEAEQDQRFAEMQVGRFLDWQAKLEQYLGEVAFEEKLADELVEKIVVSEHGCIEIRFTCDDVCTYVAELLEDGEPT